MASTRARAQTDEIQVYDAEIAAPGQLNLTWHNNYTISGRTEPTFPRGIVFNHALNGVPEVHSHSPPPLPDSPFAKFKDRHDSSPQSIAFPGRHCTPAILE